MTNLFYYFLLVIDKNKLLIFSILISFLVFTFLLDGFKLSENKIIRRLQVFIFIILIFLFLVIIKEYFFSSIIECAGSAANNTPLNNPNINLSGNVTISKQGAEEISKGITNAASNLGLGAAIGGAAAATASLAKSLPLPPMQKVGVAALGAVIGGTTHAGVTALNRSLAESKSNSTKSTNLFSSGQSSINSSSSAQTSESSFESFSIFSPKETTFTESLDSNPVETLLSSILTLNVCSLILIFFLILLLSTKIIISKNFEFKWLDSLNQNILGPKGVTLKSFILKSFNYFSLWQNKSSTATIVITLILLLISQTISVYFLSELIHNFESFSQLYLKYLNK